MAPATASGRILVVDDDRAFRHAISSSCGRPATSSTEVVDGPAALAELADRPFDVMLLDIGLPGMSGLDVLAEVQNVAAPPRVVMITADDTSENAPQSGPRPGRSIRDQTVCARRDRRGRRRSARATPAAAALPIRWCRQTGMGRAGGALLAARVGPDSELHDAAGGGPAGIGPRIDRPGVSRAALERGRMGRQAGSRRAPFAFRASARSACCCIASPTPVRASASRA